MTEEHAYVATWYHLLALIWTFVVGITALHDRHGLIGFEIASLAHSRLR